MHVLFPIARWAPFQKGGFEVYIYDIPLGLSIFHSMWLISLDFRQVRFVLLDFVNAARLKYASFDKWTGDKTSTTWYCMTSFNPIAGGLLATSNTVYSSLVFDSLQLLPRTRRLKLFGWVNSVSIRYFSGYKWNVRWGITLRRIVMRLFKKMFQGRRFGYTSHNRSIVDFLIHEFCSHWIVSSKYVTFSNNVVSCVKVA